MHVPIAVVFLPLYVTASLLTLVALEEFSRGVQMLGFDGNARLLFNGLDSSGLGKLRRQEHLPGRRVG